MHRGGTSTLISPGCVQHVGIGDYGAYCGALPTLLLNCIRTDETSVETTKFRKQIELEAAIESPQGVRFTASEKVRMDIQVELPCVTLSMRNVTVLVIDQEMSDVLLGLILPQCIAVDLNRALAKWVSGFHDVDVTARAHGRQCEQR